MTDRENYPDEECVIKAQSNEFSATACKEAQVDQDINVLALVKGEERYVFLYDDGNRAETLRTLGRYASNPELSFTWYDAAVLSQKIRNATQNAVPAPHTSKPSRFNMPSASDAHDDS